MVAERLGTPMRDELLEIQGVGDATAGKIMAVVEEHDESGTPTAVRDNVEAAYDYYNNDKPGYAGKFIRRAHEALE